MSGRELSGRQPYYAIFAQSTELAIFQPGCRRDTSRCDPFGTALRFAHLEQPSSGRARRGLTVTFPFLQERSIEPFCAQIRFTDINSVSATVLSMPSGPPISLTICAPSWSHERGPPANDLELKFPITNSPVTLSS